MGGGTNARGGGVAGVREGLLVLLVIVVGESQKPPGRPGVISRSRLEAFVEREEEVKEEEEEEGEEDAINEKEEG